MDTLYDPPMLLVLTMVDSAMVTALGAGEDREQDHGGEKGFENVHRSFLTEGRTDDVGLSSVLW